MALAVLGDWSFKIGVPCPKCKQRLVMGYYFFNPFTGNHQHTYYVCLSWPHIPDELDPDKQPGRCGWSDWTVGS